MSKAKLEAAKELIREKRYDEARAILKTFDHPTARKWEQKLDEIDPPAKPKRYTPRRMLIFLVAVILTIVGAIFILNRIQLQNRIDASMTDARVSLGLMCEFGTNNGSVRCEEYANQTLKQNPAWAIDVAFCGSLFNPISDLESFASCIVRHDVPLPS